ncbi:hypothetical protein [Spirosoma areae]
MSSVDCKLIVNRNGLLSACPTVEAFDRGAFFTDSARFLVLSVSVGPKTRQHLWDNADNAFILHPELPPHQEEEGRVYYHLVEGKITGSLYLRRGKNAITDV